MQYQLFLSCFLGLCDVGVGEQIVHKLQHQEERSLLATPTYLHQNIRGLANKLKTLNHLLRDNDPSILILVEHVLNQEAIESTQIEGYNLMAEYSRENHKLGGAVASKAKALPASMRERSMF